ncbi:type II toxin-antitoxin system CcdA family antitoxin [Pantoea sp. EA-12]|uniref:type II toxin-antitoxin system CcdA family antitoxin n=1 Tax=Pantoea sp. EA-12 TaxID=3043303 RepID=UPI0024B4F6D9|nr:type II toxin-antitoxin system CcdA family antitoxin [Pantoea sp. EA-12]MDI9219627.1 type II toxin-antitoxin system CcdA family antitoxin [Pantoea sp. EA-12]
MDKRSELDVEVTVQKSLSDGEPNEFDTTIDKVHFRQLNADGIRELNRITEKFGLFSDEYRKF